MRSIVVAVLLMGASVSGCSDPEQCSAYNAIPSTRCGAIQACCTSTQCRYTSSSGREWACAGTNCQAAATQLVRDCL
jgi:hypothetical protein